MREDFSHAVVVALEESHRIVDDFAVVGFADVAHARCRTLADVIV